MRRMAVGVVLALGCLGVASCSGTTSSPQSTARGLASDDFSRVGTGTVILSGSAGDVSLAYMDGAWYLRTGYGVEANTVAAIYKFGPGEGMRFTGAYGGLFFNRSGDTLRMGRTFPQGTINLEVSVADDGTLVCTTSAGDETACSLDESNLPVDHVGSDQL